jgi:hypothetical protein
VYLNKKAVPNDKSENNMSAQPIKSSNFLPNRSTVKVESKVANSLKREITMEAIRLNPTSSNRVSA